LLNKHGKTLLGVTVFSIVSAILLAAHLVLNDISPETEIEINPTTVKTVKGKYYGFFSKELTLTYKTTGTTFSNFYQSCGPNQAGDFAPPNCIEFQTDGQGGVVELSIGKDLLERVGDVVIPGFPPIEKQLPFQRVYTDDTTTVVKIEVPDELKAIKVRGKTLASSSPSEKFGWYALWIGAGIFIGALVGIHFVKRAIEKIYYFKSSKTTFL